MVYYIIKFRSCEIYETLIFIHVSFCVQLLVLLLLLLQALQQGYINEWTGT